MPLPLSTLVISVSLMAKVQAGWLPGEYKRRRPRSPLLDDEYSIGGADHRCVSRILRHVLLYNPLISQVQRTAYLDMQHGDDLFSKLHPDPSKPSSFQLSQLGALLSGELQLSVPVYTVYGPLEDIRVLEKFRTGEYEVKNLCILDESLTRSIEVGGLKLRLFGLGGGLQMHRICKSTEISPLRCADCHAVDNGEGTGTIAGGNGTIWTTALQIGELVDSAERVSRGGAVGGRS